MGVIAFALGIVSEALGQDADENTQTTDNYLPSMEDFEGDGGTTSGAGEFGCAEGEFCTSGHFYGAQETGGTFSYEFDFEEQMTIEEINQGFQMDYSVDVESHSSNTTVPSCNGNVLRSFDCKDIVNITVSLFSANETLEYKFEDEFELDFAGDRTFSFEEAIPENEFSELTGGVDLFGVDAGFPLYFYGPRFSNPSLTTTFDVVTFVETQVIELIEQIDILADSPIVEIQVDLAPPPPDPEVTQVENELEDEFEDEFNYEVSPVVEYDGGGTSTTGGPDSFSNDSQQEQQEVELEIEIQVEQEIQAELELEPEPEPEISVEVAPEPEPEPEMEDVAEAEEVEEQEEPTEQEANGDSEEGSSSTDSAESSDESGEEETETAETEEAEEAEEPDAKPKVVVKKSVKEKIAKRILKKMGSSGRYDSTNQIKTLVVMQILGDSKTFFEASTTLQDTEGFFSDDTIPDGLIDENNFAQYLLFGGSDAKHEAMVNSQYQ